MMTTLNKFLKKRKRSIKQNVDKNKKKRQKTSHFPKCPVCFEAMIGVKIILCGNGHSQCESCQYLQTQCPTCRIEYDTNNLVRNFDLEKMIASFEDAKILCKFGCRTEVKIKDSESHYQMCSKRLILCPLAMYARHRIEYKSLDDQHHTSPNLDTENDDESYGIVNGWRMCTDCTMIPFEGLKNHLLTRHYIVNDVRERQVQNIPLFYPFAFIPDNYDDNSIRFFETSREQESICFAISMNRECTLIDVFSLGEQRSFKITIRSNDCDFGSPGKGLVLYAIGTTRPLTEYKLHYTEVKPGSSVRLLLNDYGPLKVYYLNIEF